MWVRAAAAEPSKLFPCPDCGKEVSRRAVMCPNCGCPGIAIQEAVLAAEEAARPKHLTSVATEVRKGQAVAVQKDDQRYLLMDPFLLAGGSTLNITLFGTNEVIAYGEPELARDEPLLRFKVMGQPRLSYLALRAAKQSDGPATFLNAEDQLTSPSQGIVWLDGAGALAAIRADGQLRSINADSIWLPVKPAELRLQIDLLARGKVLSDQGKLPEDLWAELKSTKWLTPCLEKRATVLTYSK